MSGSKKSKKLVIKKTKLFPLYWIIGAILLVLGIFLLPVWGDSDVFWKTWSNEAVSLVLFGILIFLIVMMIIKIDKNQEKVIKSVRITEIALLLVLAILCALDYFGLISFMKPGNAIGFLVWLRGSMMIINCFYTYKDRRPKYLILYLILSILVISFGTYLLVSGIQTIIFSWIIAVLVIAVSLFLIIVGAIAIPEKKKTKKN